MSFGTTPTSSATFHLVFLGCWPGAAGLVLKTASPKQWLPLKTTTARLLGPLDRDIYVRQDKLLQLLVKSRNRDSRNSGFSSSCSKAATQVKHCPFASFVLDLPWWCLCVHVSVMMWCNAMHEVTTNYGLMQNQMMLFHSSVGLG